jgi:hypothetical protein
MCARHILPIKMLEGEKSEALGYHQQNRGLCEEKYFKKTFHNVQQSNP